MLRLCEVEVYVYPYSKNHSLNLLFFKKKNNKENLVDRIQVK